MATTSWVRMRISSDLKLGAQEIARYCKWRLKHVQDDLWDVCLEERYRHEPARLLTLDHVVDAENAADIKRYGTLRSWPPQDAAMSEHWPMIQSEIARVQSIGTRESAWKALGLILLAAPDAILPGQVHALYSSMAPQLAGSSLWTVREDPVISARESLSRILFSLDVTPEYAARAADEGTQASRGLLSPSRFGHGMQLETLLTITAPWLIGFAASRTGGSIVVLFGNPESGRADGVASDLIDLLRPSLLSNPLAASEPQPSVAAADVRAAMRWWVGRLSELESVVLDPSASSSSDGFHDVRRHFGLVLTMDRLFASVLTLLVGSRREEYTRRLLMFETLDILAGLGCGRYDPLLRPSHAHRALQRLEKQLPAPVARVLLPRCRAAVAALTAGLDGFYLKERIVRSPSSQTMLVVPTKSGRTEELSLERALAQYLNLVRDAGHSFDEKVKSPRDLALMASHTGDLGAEISDIAVLYFLELLLNPKSLRRGRGLDPRVGTAVFTSAG